MNEGTERVKQIEREFHDDFYDGEGPLPLLSVDVFEREYLRPCYMTGVDRYSDNKIAFCKIIQDKGGWRGKRVLDYACGHGEWAVYFALTGAREVYGFDISSTAVRRASDRVARQGLGNKVRLGVMDASDLAYASDSFHVVIGSGVIHHVIKYPRVFEEIHRVLKVGGKAFFLEGLADFPLFRLWWKLKGEVPQGDVPIFSSDVLMKTRMFSDVEIHGDSFLYSLKTFLWKKDQGRIRRFLLRACKRSDDLLLSIVPALRRWGSFSYLVFRK